MDKVKFILDWASQQSTQKAILAALAVGGIVIDPTKIEAIVAAFFTGYALLAGLRDKS